MTLSLLLLVASLILFVLAGFRVGDSRVSLGWLGAACAVGALLLGKAL